MAGAQRSLADVLRGMDAPALSALLARRPDLSTPSPTDLDELVDRAASRSSTRLALESLDAWTLQCARAMAAQELGGEDFDPVALAASLGMPAEGAAVESAVDELRRLALVWGEPPRLTQTVRAVFGRYPGGLAGASAEPMDERSVALALDRVGAAGRKILAHLLWDSPTGKVSHADRTITPENADSTMDLLLAYRLLRPVGPDQVILPREVALLLRGGLLVHDPVPPRAPGWGTPSAQLGASLPAGLVDRAAIGSAQELVSHVIAVLEDLGGRMPRRLSSGGVPKKELTRLAHLVGDPFVAEFAVALGFGSRMLVGQGPVLAVTTCIDSFLELGSFHRWLSLRSDWRALDWWPTSGLVSHPAVLRTAAFAELAGAEPGTGVTAEGLANRLAWRHPAWAGIPWSAVADQLLHEAGLLGLVAFGRTTALVHASQDEPDPGFSPLGRTLILQSDLTAVAPTPLDHETARVTAMLAERESHGATATFRFSQGSLRHALDIGWAPEDILGWLHEHDAAGPQAALPQPLTALLGDVARRHGRIRVTAVSAVIQVDDETTLAALLHDPTSAELGLARLGPGMLTSTAEPEDVVGFLREHGLAPVAQDSQGVRFTAPPEHRAPAAPQAAPPTVVDTDALAARLVRTRDRGMAPEQVVAALAVAHREDRWVILDWADADGSPRSGLVRVLSLAPGVVNLVRRGAGRLSVPLAHVLGVTEQEPS